MALPALILAVLILGPLVYSFVMSFFEWGITDINRVYTAEELAKGEVMFAATGVTTGPMLRGVRRFPNGAETHSIVMRSKSGTVRYVEGHHNFARKPAAFVA